MILDFIAWRHPQPSIKSSLKAVAVFVVFYLIDVHCFKYYTDVWAYPIMSELNTPLRLAFFGVCAVICTIDFFVAYGFNSFIVPNTVPNKSSKKLQ
uniref:Uncharacterized protein n=1 Tax=Panagrolaimus sp. JU765 TaxID=591449 RepID=A0AC34RT10_9BILA